MAQRSIYTREKFFFLTYMTELIKVNNQMQYFDFDFSYLHAHNYLDYCHIFT